MKISTLCSQNKLPLETQIEDFLGPPWAESTVLFFVILLNEASRQCESISLWGWSSPVLLSECWNAEPWLQDWAHHPPWNPPFFFFIGYRGTPPPPPNLSSFHQSFSSFTFSSWSSLPGFFPISNYLNLWSFFELSWHPILSLHLCPSLRQWHMDCVNSWAAGQPQIRHEHTAHEAQLFKRLSPIAHTSYPTSSTAEVQINQTSFVCLWLLELSCAIKSGKACNAVYWQIDPAGHMESPYHGNHFFTGEHHTWSNFIHVNIQATRLLDHLSPELKPLMIMLS